MRSIRAALLTALMAIILPFLLADRGLGQETCEVDSDCDDERACTTDACDPTHVDADSITGCVIVPINAACDDGASCTVDLCDPSHIDADVVTGCVIEPNNAACGDGDECTDDRCDPESPDADETSGCTFPPADPLPGACVESTPTASATSTPTPTLTTTSTPTRTPTASATVTGTPTPTATATSPSGVSLDIDGDGQRKPLTDGVLALRYLFDFRDAALIAGAVASGAPRDTAEEVEDYLASILPALDIDDDETVEPLGDGRLILRYLFGFRGPILIADAVGENAQRDTAEEIENYLASIL